MKVFLYVGGVFAFVSVILLTVFGFTINNYLSFQKNAQITSGKIIDSVIGKDSKGRIGVVQFIVEYELNGKKFQYYEDNTTNPPLYSVNENVEILYDPNNPSNVKIKSVKSLIGPAIILFIGSVFFFLGFVFLFMYFKNVFKKNRLRKIGLQINAIVLGSRLDTTLKVNGQSPFVVEYQFTYKPTGKVLRGISEHIWFDPIVSGHYEKGGNITILVNMSKPSENTAILKEFN